MKGIDQVQAFIVTIFDALTPIGTMKYHVAGGRQDISEPQDAAEGDARPFTDCTPTIHTVVTGYLRASWQSSECRQRELQRRSDQSADGELPAGKIIFQQLLILDALG